VLLTLVGGGGSLLSEWLFFSLSLSLRFLRELHSASKRFRSAIPLFPLGTLFKIRHERVRYRLSHTQHTNKHSIDTT
jgi:hypothetical protein